MVLSKWMLAMLDCLVFARRIYFKV